MKLIRMLCGIALIGAALSPAAQERVQDPVLATMKLELTRNFEALKKAPVPPYFLSYQLTDNRAIQIRGEFGALISSEDQRTRLLDIDLRVGDYTLDNSHESSGAMPRFRPGQLGGPVKVPLDSNPQALRMVLWHETDREYKEASERFGEIKTNVQVKVAAEDRSADFSREPAQSYFEPEAPFAFDRGQWEEKIRKYTSVFAKHAAFSEGRAEASAELETRRYVNSDGSEIRISMPLYRLMISAVARADDGMQLPLHETFMSFTPEGLPDDATVLKTVEHMESQLEALRKAPLAEPYTGPAILSGRASAVFFHEVFGHRVEGHRQKAEDEAQTFKKQVNQRVLPDSFSVYSDPTLRRMGNTDLVGYYAYDDEGVKAQRVAVVQNGTLKNFLMSRSPIEGFAHSNGHGRRQQGFAVVARQSNLVVQAAQQVSRAELKKRLIEQVKTANKPYGLFFDDIEGGYTFTQRGVPNAFNVLPTVVYRVYPDGREELVRGVDLIGTPLIAFSKIMAADDEVGVFNGLCGAESGYVPVSAVSPGILVEQIEVQRKEKSQESAPVLPPPARNQNQPENPR